MSSSPPPLTAPPLLGVWLGRRPYSAVYHLQKALLEQRKQGAGSDVVLLVEHDPVITLGRGTRAGHLLASPAVLERRGVEVVVSDRGGDATLHAPGQLVAYPIVALPPTQRDVRRYVRGLANVMRALVAPLGIDGGAIDQYIGLWVDTQQPHHWPGEAHVQRPAKIGAIGVRISRWVTMHGFALNVSTDLSLFQLIVPCGIAEHGVTSVTELGGEGVELAELAQHAHRLLAHQLERHAVDLWDATGDSLERVTTRLIPG